MVKVTDLHCHLLPGLDDGVKEENETYLVLEEAVKQNVGRIIMTPHFHPGRVMVSTKEVQETLKQIKQGCEKKGIQLELFAGHECYYHTGLIKDLEEGRALTLANSRYVLIEFEPECPYFYLLRATRELINSGYFPILAHYERYSCLLKKERLEELKQQGALLQLNFDTLRRRGWFRGNSFRRDLKAGLVDYLGSDCHGLQFRPLHIKEVYQWLERNVSEELIDRILYTNVERIFESNMTKEKKTL